MQAAGRSYRLNQTHTHCKTYYLFAEGTMEQTAVQLMSRKQRAAKLLTGDIGLTGLDALTEGEGGFEEALLEAIGRDEALLNPSELFKQSEAQGEIDSEDAAYWNVERAETENEELVADSPVMQVELHSRREADSLIQEAIQLGGIVTEIKPEPVLAHADTGGNKTASLMTAITSYLDTVHIIPDEQKLSALRVELLDLLQTSPSRVQIWLSDNRVVFPGCEAEVAAQLLLLTRQALDSSLAHVSDLRPVVVRTKARKSMAAQTRPKPELPDRIEETATLHS